ncbi:MAG TPA: hypothetical protein VIL30_02440, partial [Ramlibacter sp.]
FAHQNQQGKNMISYLLAGSAEEPVSLAEANAFLKVDDGAEDGLITTLIGAARLHIEGVTGRALLAQSWRVVLDQWPESGQVKLPVTPFRGVTQITAYDEDGVGHEVPLAQFLREPDRLVLPGNVTGMPMLRERQGIEIDYVAGFGTEAGDVPVDIRQALLVLVAYWFEHRDAVIIAGSGSIVPSGFDRLVASYKRVRL